MTLRWTRIAAVLILLLATLEATSQAFIYAWAGKPFRSLSLLVWSPYGLVRNNPDVTSPKYQIDRDGFRNLENFARLKPPGTFRVILLGGSVLYAGLSPLFLQEEGRVDSRSTIGQYMQQAMEADPDLKGLKIEVINAAVNYNRIVETSSAYLAEYAFWSPDLVVVFGSANNFLTQPDAESIRNRTHNIEGDHPWRLEFDREVNGNGLAAIVEKVVRAAGDNLASIALVQRAVSKATDVALGYGSRFALREPSRKPWVPASQEQEEQYFREYTAFTDAMIAAARRHGQEIAFFWEYFLSDLAGIKPMSERELWLYEQVKRPEAVTQYSFRMRDRWRAHFAQAGVGFVDPVDTWRAASGTDFIDYLHYTRRGNKLMAEETYRRLKPQIMQVLARRGGGR
jgi:hypothetical protein